jgi:hypothetical protein
MSYITTILALVKRLQFKKGLAGKGFIKIRFSPIIDGNN